jgi:hypothetical protein
MRKIKLKFVDFWPGFLEKDNYLYNVISKHWSVEFSENPDVIFFSCYGESYLNYNCIRIFYSSENMRTDFTGCDFALTFDYLKDHRHFRLPLYVFYIEQQRFWGKLTQQKNQDQLDSEWRSKSKSCCMVISNGLAKERINFFNKLSKYISVDSGGKFLNNIGGPIEDKLTFIRDYRFIISYENSSFPGYTTEKLIEPMMVGSIPIYWGDPNVSQEFNSNRFLNRQDYCTDEELIEKILYINNNNEKAIEMVSEPIFNKNELPECIQEKAIMNFINKIFSDIDKIKPVASTNLKYVHYFNKKKTVVKYFIQRTFNQNFR